ncbi:hypothetical protein HDU93_001787, partial [Gonapodya sp. JEL0774]
MTLRTSTLPNERGSTPTLSPIINHGSVSARVLTVELVATKVTPLSSARQTDNKSHSKARHVNASSRPTSGRSSVDAGSFSDIASKIHYCEGWEPRRQGTPVNQQGSKTAFKHKGLPKPSSVRSRHSFSAPGNECHAEQTLRDVDLATNAITSIASASSSSKVANELFYQDETTNYTERSKRIMPDQSEPHQGRVRALKEAEWEKLAQATGKRFMMTPTFRN